MATGGLERVVLLLAREMVSRKREVVICCYDKLGELVSEAERAGAQVELVSRKQGVDLWYIWHLSRWLKRIQPDVLHMHNETALFYGTLAGRLAHVPILIYTEHDGVFPRGFLARWMNRRLIKRLTHTVAISNAVRELWCDSDGIELKRVKVVPNGVPGNAATSRQARQRDATCIRIGTVGRLSYEKGTEMLIEAFGLVREHLPKSKLVLVGDGPERSRLEQMTLDRGLTDCVDFLGTRNDVPALLTSFDIFVLPSRSEGLPMALLEAMATGLPIVATAVGGVPEAIRDGKSGLLIPPEQPQAIADALIRFASDEALRNSIGSAARQDFEQRYELSRMVNAYENLMKG